MVPYPKCKGVSWLRPLCLVGDVVVFVRVGAGAAGLAAIQAGYRVHLVTVQTEVEDLEVNFIRSAEIDLGNTMSPR